MKNNILVAYTGKGDRIRIFADSVDLTVSFYDLQRVLQLIEADLPPPCPTCKGFGTTTDEEGRTIMACETCNGTRVVR